MKENLGMKLKKFLWLKIIFPNKRFYLFLGQSKNDGKRTFDNLNIIHSSKEQPLSYIKLSKYLRFMEMAQGLTIV